MSTTNELERRIRELERENKDLRALLRGGRKPSDADHWRLRVSAAGLDPEAIVARSEARRLSREHGCTVVPVLIRGEYKYFRKRERSIN